MMSGFTLPLTPSDSQIAALRRYAVSVPESADQRSEPGSYASPFVPSEVSIVGMPPPAGWTATLYLSTNASNFPSGETTRLPIVPRGAWGGGAAVAGLLGRHS